jgi:hypothetical protein
VPSGESRRLHSGVTQFPDVAKVSSCCSSQLTRPEVQARQSALHCGLTGLRAALVGGQLSVSIRSRRCSRRADLASVRVNPGNVPTTDRRCVRRLHLADSTVSPSDMGGVLKPRDTLRPRAHYSNENSRSSRVTTSPLTQIQRGQVADKTAKMMSFTHDPATQHGSRSEHHMCSQNSTLLPLLRNHPVAVGHRATAVRHLVAVLLHLRDDELVGIVYPFSVVDCLLRTQEPVPAHLL